MVLHTPLWEVCCAYPILPQNNLQTCLRVPHIGQSIFTARKDEASTGSERAVDSLPVVGGTYIFLHCKTVTGKTQLFVPIDLHSLCFFYYFLSCWYHQHELLASALTCELTFKVNMKLNLSRFTLNTHIYSLTLHNASVCIINSELKII